jgi:hypothetical protein
MRGRKRKACADPSSPIKTVSLLNTGPQRNARDLFSEKLTGAKIVDGAFLFSGVILDVTDCYLIAPVLAEERSP